MKGRWHFLTAEEQAEFLEWAMERQKVQVHKVKVTDFTPKTSLELVQSAAD
jgi:hypothetical protein